MKDIYEILERIREKSLTYFDLGDWGSFYTKQIFPIIKEENSNKFEVWRGFYITSDLNIIPARLFILTELDGKKVPDYMFYFQVLDRDCNILASNI